MKNILILGAGRTATALVEYLLKYSAEEDWFITLGDFSLEAAEQKIAGHSRGKAIQFDIYNEAQRAEEISKADIVISFLLPGMHIFSARECLKYKTHLVTASYVSPQMAELNKDAASSGLIFLCEMGLDPGIDHMDLMRLVTKIKKNNGKLFSVKSYCGGLVSPESDDNPWGYKFTWSPLNVVLAGQGIARYKTKGEVKVVPYRRLFLNTETIGVPGYGVFEAYPNRDSIPYLKKFGLEDIPNFYRATLRRPGFTEAWHALVTIGLTDNSYSIPDSDSLTYRDWVKSYLPKTNGRASVQDIAVFLNLSSGNDIIKKIKYLNLLRDEKIKIPNATPAQILLSLLEEKWKFKSGDNDLVILQTEAEFESENKTKKMISSMTYKGEGNTHTAMTFTAGIPAAIGAKLILQNKIKERGVIIPSTPDIYEPALKELESCGIVFKEEEIG
jgi:saccharopine dehydrogenase-like NADP-dependent oxidoreductase